MYDLRKAWVIEELNMYTVHVHVVQLGGNCEYSSITHSCPCSRPGVRAASYLHGYSLVRKTVAVPNCGTNRLEPLGVYK